LRAVFEHSYRLLTDDKQRVFCGLAVFRTGFTAEAAQQVAEATPEVLEALVEHSMLRYDPNTGYYDLHELVRQYGLDKLKAKGMESDLRQRHSTYYMQALERWGIQQEGAGQVVALIEMDHQLADVQTAWEWACQQQALAGLTKGWKGLCRYYAYRFRPVEGEHDLKAALDMLDGLAEHKPQSQRLKAQLLNYLSVFQIDSGRNDRSKLRQTLEKKSIDILEDLQQAGEDVRLDMAWIINDLANTITDSEQAIRLVQHGLDLARQVGSKRYQAMLLEHLAWIYFSSDDILKAEHCCQEALAICRLIGDPWRLADTLQTLSLIIITQGKIQSGLQAALESAQLYHTLSDRVIYNYGVNSLGLIFWFGRKWEEADKTYDENTPRLQDIGDRKLLCYDGSRWSIIKMFLGQYEAELAMAGRYLKLANQLDDLFSQALKNFVLGGVALAQGHADQAISSLEKAAALIKQTGNQSDWAMTVGTLSMALSWIGQLRQAQAQLIEALRTGTELHSYLSLSYAVPAAALLLVNTNQVERAVELCALIDEQAMCGKTPWFEDVAGREIKQLAASLPSSVVEAARERGRQRDLFLTAAELLEEFKNKQ
jgi:tetratricopeptide (TPR) repeat protein